MKKYFNKIYLPAMLGATIEYYDIALYGYMAPVLVQVFLPQLPKTTAYFFYFLFEFFASISQLAGAYFYGKMGDNQGRKKAMYYAMLGISCTTFAISILPSYHSIGTLATFLFVTARCMQGFFLGGEYNGGAIYCLEHEQNHKKYGLISGLYCSLTVSGIIAASLIATIINHYGSEYFRIAYAISFLLAIFTYSLRKKIKETSEFLKIKAASTDLAVNKEALKSSYNSSYNSLFILGISSLFFGISYGMPTRIFNIILPLATGINTSKIMIINTTFLILYMLLLIVFGIVADRLGIVKIMRLASFGTILLTYPMIMLIKTKYLIAIIIAKAVFASLAAAFIAPFHAFAQNLFRTEIRYKHISIGYALGKCVATLVLALSVLIYQHLGNLSGMGLILIILAIVTWRTLNER